MTKDIDISVSGVNLLRERIRWLESLLENPKVIRPVDLGDIDMAIQNAEDVIKFTTYTLERLRSIQAALKKDSQGGP